MLTVSFVHYSEMHTARTRLLGRALFGFNPAAVIVIFIAYAAGEWRTLDFYTNVASIPVILAFA